MNEGGDRAGEAEDLHQRDRGIPLRTEQHAQDRMGEQREDDREGPADRREIGDAAQVAVLQRMALAQLGGKGRQQDRHESLEDALAVDLEDRKSVEEGKRGSVGVELDGGRIIKKKKKKKQEK